MLISETYTIYNVLSWT